MNLFDAVNSCLSKYATMQGRAPRSKYWWFVLATYLMYILVVIVFSLIGFAVGDVGGALIAAYIGYFLLSIFLFLPSLCVLVRRLHDTGHGGQWFFICLVPFIGSLWLLILMLTGSDEENRFGLPVY